jgi:hypothetical protein
MSGAWVKVARGAVRPKASLAPLEGRLRLVEVH